MRSALTGSTFLALSCVAPFTGLIGVAEAQTPAQQGTELEGMTVTDTVITNEGRRQESPKATRPVRDLPQTVTILTNEVIEQQNLLTLRDVLSTVPGITFGAGEGGGGYGDSINLRGYSANSDITIDGVRDSAQYSRTDPFNLEQIEVTNGANGAVAGSGSVGGSINIVSKRPQAEDRTTLSAGIGTDNYYRAAIDSNWRLNDKVAVRLNAMAHKNDIPGRDVEKYERWGVAPSVKIGVDGPTSLTFLYWHQEDENTPQYGVPYYQVAGGIPDGVNRSDYFGYRNIDTQETVFDQASMIFEHEFSDRLNIRNLTRWQNVTQFALVDPPQGTYCLASTGLTPTDTSCTTGTGAAAVTTPRGYYQPSGPRGTTRDSRNQMLYNQVDLRAVVDTGGIEHTITLGGAVTWEKYRLDSGNSLRNPDGTVAFATLPLINIADPNTVVVGPGLASRYGSNVYAGPVNFIRSASQDGELENYAIYLFDTMKLSEQFELNGALRYERNKGWYRAGTITAAGVETPGETFGNSDNLFSYRAGLVYKPIEPVSLYVAYGNSKTPSKTSVNGSCTSATCNVKPETAVNYEAGIKAEVGAGVLLSAAVFRNERKNFRVASADPLVPEQQLDGRSRVNGLSLSAIGQITPDWAVTANYTYLDSEVLRSVATNPAPGTTPPIDLQAGDPLPNTPKHSGSVFTTYRLPFGLTIGYGATYQGKFALNNGAPTIFKVDDYLIHNVLLTYPITEGLEAQLNVKNVSGEKYFTRVRNNGWATPGEARSAVLTLNFSL